VLRGVGWHDEGRGTRREERRGRWGEQQKREKSRKGYQLVIAKKIKIFKKKVSFGFSRNTRAAIGKWHIILLQQYI
jgi:hypothetical protein